MRIGAIDPYQLGEITAWAERLNAALDPLQHKPLNVHLLVYGALIQAGLERIHLVKPNDVTLPDPGPGLRRRVRDEAATKWGLTYLVLSGLLPTHEGATARDARLRWERNRLLCFLTSALSAPHRSVNVVWFGTPPPRYVLQRHLPPELLVPLGSLFDTMQGTETRVAVPQFSLHVDDVTRANEVINSASYDGYVHSHVALHDPQCPVAKAARVVTEAANKLQRANRRILMMKRTPLWLLSGVGRIIDAVAGRLPAAITDMVGKALTSHLSLTDRVVIYDCSATARAIRAAVAKDSRRLRAIGDVTTVPPNPRVRRTHSRITPLAENRKRRATRPSR